MFILPNSGARASKNLPFPFQCIIFQKGQMFDAPSSSPGGDRDMCHWVFCRKFNIGQLLFDAFSIYSVLLAESSSKINLLSNSSALFQKWQMVQKLIYFLLVASPGANGALWAASWRGVRLVLIMEFLDLKKMDLWKYSVPHLQFAG